MTNNIPKLGIGVLIYNSEGEILLGERINSHGEGMWAPAGGHLEFGETFEECAIRETLEETGLEIKDPKFLAITNDFFAEANKHYVSIFMTVQYPNNQTVINTEPDKIEEWSWFDFNNLPDNLFLPLKQLIAGHAYGNKLYLKDHEIIL